MLNQNNKITIGVTAYKDSDYLEMAINSVLNQTSSNWNGVLVLDGGSDQKTKKNFDEFKHPKFQKYELLENKGPYGTRAKAIELSGTEWYYQLDGDDSLPSNAISDILSAIDNNPGADYVYGDCLHFDCKKSFIKKPSDDIEKLCYSLQFNGQSPIKVRLFEKIGGFAPELYNNADWDFWISAYEIGAVGVKINKIIYHRRLRHGNVGSIYFEDKPDNLEKIIIRHPQFFNVKRKTNARYKVNELLARHFRSNGNREKAYTYAKKTEEYGILTATLLEIIREYKMNWLRFLVRKIARRMNIFIDYHYK
jgi:glycosyltransferase involved in cell wall biosynthesis